MKKRESIVKLSKHNLDDAAEDQSYAFLEASDKQAKYGKEKEEKERELNKLEASLARKYRTKPKKYLGVDKATDKAINEKITLNKKVDELRKELIEIKYKYNKSINLVKSLDQRRSSIKYLSELFLGGYWHDDRVSPTDRVDKRMNKKKGE